MKPVCVVVEQLLLPFEYWETEKQIVQDAYKCKIDDLRYYPDPKNEQEKLFNLQKEYYQQNKDKKILAMMFPLLIQIARKVCVQTSKSYGFKCSSLKLEEVSMDATTIIIEQIQKNELMIQKSFVSYIRLQVLKAMFGQTLAQKFEKYCRQNNINLFALSDTEKQKVKERFEKEMKEKGNEENLLHSL